MTLADLWIAEESFAAMNFRRKRLRQLATVRAQR
jgi:hypothetical protein